MGRRAQGDEAIALADGAAMTKRTYRVLTFVPFLVCVLMQIVAEVGLEVIDAHEPQ